MNKKMILIFGTLLAIMISGAAIVYHPISAQQPPSPQHRFGGRAQDNTGKSIADGITIRAMIVDLDDGTTQNFTQLVYDGWYGYPLDNNSRALYVESEGGHARDPIYFYIGCINTTQVVNFSIGGWTNLTLTIDDEPRILSDNSDTSGTTGDQFTFNVTIGEYVDSGNELTVKVNWTHGSYAFNNTMTCTGGDNINGFYFEKTINLYCCSVENLSYYFYVNDTSGNSNISQTYYATVTDNDPPEFSEFPSTMPNQGEEYNFTINVTDNIEVSTVWLNYCFTGSWNNVSMNYSSSSGLYYYVLSVPDDANILRYNVSANDTSNNWNETGEKSIIINGSIVYVDDDADPSWYDSIHVKTIQEGVTNVSTNGTVYVYNGTYCENVFIRKALTLIGNSTEATILDAINGTGIKIEANNTLIENLTIFNSSTGIWIYNNSFAITNVKISNCTIYNNEYGVYISNGNNNTISFNRIYNNYYYGIEISGGGENNEIISNIIYGHSEDEASGIWDDGYYTNITNNTLYDNYYGILVYGEGDNDCVNVTNNNLTNCTISIYITGSSYNTIMNNIVTNSSQKGIYLDCSSYNNVTNNILNSTVDDAIYLSGYSNYNNVTNNVIFDSNQGIDLQSSSYNTVANNSISDVDNEGIYVFGEENDDEPIFVMSNTISSNTIDNCDYGIHTSYSLAAIITGNDISSAIWCGILLENSNNSEISDNVIYNILNGVGLVKSSCNNVTGNIIFNSTSNGDGIYSDRSSGNIIDNNLVYSMNDGSGIHVMSGSSDEIITNNTLRDITDGYGIWIEDASNNTLSGNTIAEIKYGIYLYESSYIIITLNNVSSRECALFVNTSNYNNINNNSMVTDNVSFLVLYLSINNSIVDNTFSNNSIIIYGDEIDQYIHTIDGNTVNGKPLYYYKNSSNFSVPNDAGAVILVNCTNAILTDANISYVGCGIEIAYSQNVTVINLSLSNSTLGIWSIYNEKGNIQNSTLRNNVFAISDIYSNSTDIEYNDIANNFFGTFIVSCNNGTIKYNNLTNLFVDLSLDNSNNNIICHNKFNTSGFIGVSLSNSSNNNTIYTNYVNNSLCGLYINSSSSNLIYNNYLNNTLNVIDDSTNTWNITKLSGTNIVGGPYVGGNYWSDYTGIDEDHDGIGDKQYNISGTNIDYLPLVISPSVTSTNPTSGSTGVSISTNIVVTFSKPMNQSATQNSFSISPSVSGTFSWSNNNTTLTFDPISSLSYSTKYTVTIGWNATDSNGNVMLSNYTFSFTTTSAPPSGGGGGGAPSPPDTTPPSTPTNVRCTSQINDNTPSFAWDAATDESGIAGYYVKIDNGTEISVGNVLTYTWTTAIPDGTHTFYVRAKDNYGNYGNYGNCTFTINTSLPPNQPPVANANGPYYGLTYQNITFDGSASYDPDGAILNYTWSFGDGSYGYGKKPIYAYNKSGIFNVTLTVKDDQGSTASDTTYVVIEQDSDGDGLSDELEDLIGSDPNSFTLYVKITIENYTTYLVDTNNDSIYDTLYNKDTNVKTVIAVDKDGNYLIDYNGDGIIDFIYNPTTGQTSKYEKAPEEKPIEIPWAVIIVVIVIIVAIVIVIYIRRFSF